ncbi:hypothetical protein KJ359_011936 [Pestalotiopsis sp. 9143b]|nr:hypothetical protein KJ359_011936 [Pestalotiopsis sp. 9143b]
MSLILQRGFHRDQGALPLWDRLVLLDIAIQARCANNALWILGHDELKIDFSSLDYDTEAFSSGMFYECLNPDKPEIYEIAVEMLAALGENVLVEPVNYKEEGDGGVSFTEYIGTIHDEMEGAYDSDEADNQSDLDDTDQEDFEGAETDGGDSDVQDGGE